MGRRKPDDSDDSRRQERNQPDQTTDGPPEYGLLVPPYEFHEQNQTETQTRLQRRNRCEQIKRSCSQSSLCWRPVVHLRQIGRPRVKPAHLQRSSRRSNRCMKSLANRGRVIGSRNITNRAKRSISTCVAVRLPRLAYAASSTYSRWATSPRNNAALTYSLLSRTGWPDQTTPNYWTAQPRSCGFYSVRTTTCFARRRNGKNKG